MKNTLTKYSVCLGAILSLYASPSFAIGTRDISVDLIEKGINLSLSRGYGVVINLSPIGQSISTAWLSDPSQIVLSSNKGACTGNKCAGASVLYLKPINRLIFPGLPGATDGASLLSVITNNGSVLQFKLSVTSSVPSYTNILVTPPQPKLPPIVRLPRQATPAPLPIRPVRPTSEKNDIEILNLLEQKKTPEINPQEIKTDPRPEKETSIVTPKEQVTSAPKTQQVKTLSAIRSNQETAAALLRGLNSQRGRSEVGRSLHYKKAQDLMYLLRKHPTLSLDEAIARARMNPTIAKTLINYGQR